MQVVSGGIRMKNRLQIADEAVLTRTATILGPSSAAAKSLAEVERRRAAGEDVFVFLHRDRNVETLIVGPMP